MGDVEEINEASDGRSLIYRTGKWCFGWISRPAGILANWLRPSGFVRFLEVLGVFAILTGIFTFISETGSRDAQLKIAQANLMAQVSQMIVNYNSGNFDNSGLVHDVIREAIKYPVEGLVFSGVSLRGVHLCSMEFRDADLVGGDFATSIMNHADFKGADLRNANLRSVAFSGASLWNAKMAGADVSNAEFAGANLTGADFRGVAWDKGFMENIRGFFSGDVKGLTQDQLDQACISVGGKPPMLPGMDVRGEGSKLKAPKESQSCPERASRSLRFCS